MHARVCPFLPVALAAALLAASASCGDGSDRPERDDVGAVDVPVADPGAGEDADADAGSPEPGGLPDDGEDGTGDPGDAKEDDGGTGAPDAADVGATVRDRVGDTDLLIVTTAALRAPFDELAAWKTRKGIPARVWTMEEVRAGAPGVPDDATALREALREAAAGGTQWVLLGGRPPLVPVRKVHCQAYNAAEDATLDADVIADLYFADLDGDWDADGDGVYGEPGDGLGDMAPELWVGRVPAASAAEAQAYVDKVMAYERRPVAGYQATAVLMGEVAASMQGMVLCSTTVFESSIADRFPDDFSVTKMYDPACGDFPDAVLNSDAAQLQLWQAGDRHIVVHLGHGNLETLGRIDPVDCRDRIPATTRPAVFLTCQCDSCMFDQGDRAGCEYFLTDPWGGVIYMGNTDFGVGFPWETLFYDALLADLFADPGTSVGQRFADTLATYGDDSGGDLDAPDSDFRWTRFTLHLMADPSLVIWTTVPVQAEAGVVRDEAGGAWSVRVTAGGQPVGGATVALHWSGAHLFVARTGMDGVARFAWGAQGVPGAGGALTVTGATIVPIERDL